MFDGIALGVQVEKLKLLQEKVQLVLGRKSQATLSATTFKSRTFIKTKSNRTILKESAEKNEWPRKTKGNLTAHDPGMDKFWQMLDTQDVSSPLPTGLKVLMSSLSTSTSTSNLFQFFSSKSCLSSLSHSSSLTDLNIKLNHSDQAIDKDLLNQLKTNLKDKKNLGYAHGTTRADLQTFQELKSKYPVWAEITNSLSVADVLNQEMADFLIAIIEHTEQVFESAPIRSAKEMVKKFSRNIFQTFRCSENALSIRCTAMLKMKSRWRICAPKFFLLTIHWLPALWSWLAPALRKLCMDSRSWQAARVHKWSLTVSCHGFHKIILHR